jgi:hypothetical protein
LATKTINFGLVKPDLTDAADITMMNQNWDEVDELLGDLAHLSADSIVEQNNGNDQKFWVGTKEEYDAIRTKDPNTQYTVTDEDEGGIPASYLTGKVSIANGGTGASDGATGLKNLLASGGMVLSSYQYGTELPTAGTPGRIFFKVVE